MNKNVTIEIWNNREHFLDIQGIEKILILPGVVGLEKWLTGKI
jgi:hypothetical protein